jgi:hypothetical protein
MAGLVTMAVIGGSIIWDVVGPPDQPEPNDREAVRERLGQVDGIRPVLPTTVPPGYNFARDYDPYAVGPEPISFDGTIEPADLDMVTWLH